MKDEIKLTKAEEKQILKNRQIAEDKKAEADLIEQYDNNYCYDENGNWKY